MWPRSGVWPEGKALRKAWWCGTAIEGIAQRERCDEKGDRAPTTVDGIAELSVWDLKKALHVCAIDTALMEEITFAIISGLLMKLRGA